MVTPTARRPAPGRSPGADPLVVPGAGGRVPGLDEVADRIRWTLQVPPGSESVRLDRRVSVDLRACLMAAARAQFAGGPDRG